MQILLYHGQAACLTQLAGIERYRCIQRHAQQQPAWNVTRSFMLADVLCIARFLHEPEETLTSQQNCLPLSRLEVCLYLPAISSCAHARLNPVQPARSPHPQSWYAGTS